MVWLTDDESLAGDLPREPFDGASHLVDLAVYWDLGTLWEWRTNGIYT